MSESRGATFIRERWPLLIALWVAVSSNVAIFAILWPHSQAVDFTVFWRAVRAPQPYALHGPPFVYPPTALLWFAPLKLADLWTCYAVWGAASIAFLLAASVWLYGRGATALAMVSPALAVGLIPGQTSLLAAALLFAAFATDGSVCRGILLGALLTFKPQLAVTAPLFLLVRRDWPALAATLGSAALLAGATTALFGAEVWSNWIVSIPAFQQIVADTGLSLSAVSPAAFAAAIGAPRLPLLIIGCVGAVIIALKSRDLSQQECPAMIATASLLASPYALRYDLIAIAPAMAAVILSHTGRKALLACIAYSASFGPFSLAAAASVVQWRRERAPESVQKS